MPGPAKGGSGVKVRHKRLVRGFSIAIALGLACAGLLTGVAGAQTDAAPGVTDKEIKLGYISSQTGAAASIYKNAHKACQARVGAENAKGGVNGRKIGLEIIDDQSGPGTSPPRRISSRTARSSRCWTTRRWPSCRGATSRTPACR